MLMAELTYHHFELDFKAPAILRKSLRHRGEIPVGIKAHNLYGYKINLLSLRLI